jgi:hypothetical protein
VVLDFTGPFFFILGNSAGIRVDRMALECRGMCINTAGEIGGWRRHLKLRACVILVG